MLASARSSGTIPASQPGGAAGQVFVLWAEISCSLVDFTKTSQRAAYISFTVKGEATTSLGCSHIG